MKRGKFLVTLLALAPVAALARFKNFVISTSKGFKVSAGEGRFHGHLQLKGVNANVLDVKISGKDTEGALAIFEQTSLSPGRGTPMHIHHFQDEVFKVIEGEYVFQVGGEKHQLRTGDAIFLPRKVPHAWTQISAKGKMNVIVQPAGKLENFFIAMAALTQEPTKEQIAGIFADNEMEVVGPPLKLG